MIVSLRPDGTIGLDEPGDCKRFHVAVPAAGDGDDVDLDAALRRAGAGRMGDDGDARISVDSVRRLAAGHVGDEWAAEFAGMLAFAESKGWLDDGGTSIRAHVQRGTV